jgi:uncharacterized protein (TIGR02246 family)
MKILIVGLALALMSATVQTGSSDADRRAIEAIAASFQDAWNRHDIDALASLLAEDVDFVTVEGARGWEKGRNEFRQLHAAAHRTMFRESVLTVKETHVRFVQPGLAITHVLWKTSGDTVADRKPGDPREGIFTWVLQKQSGTWLIIASQNTENKKTSVHQ